MLSRYNGSICQKCKGKIWRGIEIVKDTELGWIHKTCPSKGHKYGVNEPLPIVTNPIVDFDNLANEIEAVEDEPRQPEKEFVPSKYQQAIFDFVSNGEGHAVVEAVAGSGKTTTIVKALDLTPKDASVGFLAFNKHIAQELKKKSPEHVHVSTLHSLGLQVFRKNYSGVKVDDDKVGLLLDDVYPVSKQALSDGKITKEERKDNFAKRLSMRKLVSICKSTMIDTSNNNQVMDTIDRYGIDIDEQFVDELVSHLSKIMEMCKENLEIVDFDDMIWLPVILDMTLEKFDFLMVDEAQDMNKLQIEFILKSISDNGRIIAVGDRRQSLYGFRGADTNAIPNIIKALDATVLPLSVTYRCPASHVAKVKSIVPQIEARDNAPEGYIEYMEYFDLVSKLEVDDMVICRTNAPLVKPALECIRVGKKAIIRGKDIGSTLINLIKRFETDDLAQFEVSLEEYYQHEYNKLLEKSKEMQAILLTDRVETLRYIMNECNTVSDLMNKIQMLFDDNNRGVVFSSVHRAKGLEAKNVFVLRPDLMPHPKAGMGKDKRPDPKKQWELVQESNGLYVAWTRSKENLYFVKGGEDI